MKDQIHIPSTNIFEERSKQFLQSKLAARLNKKYQPKPFEESYKPMYWLSYVGFYSCNLISILTASTFVFSYLLLILSELPFPIVWASIFTFVSLVLIEILQRFLAPKLFQNILQFGFKFSSVQIILVYVWGKYFRIK